MPFFNSREKERELLIERLFWDSSPGSNLEDNPLFSICRELGSDYCLGFNENGYTKKYEGFNSKKVRSEALRLMNDESLDKYVEKYSDKLHIYRSFYGQFYTFDRKNRKLYHESRWSKIEEKLLLYLNKYKSNGKAVLEAIYEVNTVQSTSYKNYYMVMTLAKNKGLGKGWRTLLSELQLMDLIDDDTKHILITEEVLPLVEKVLMHHGN